MVLLKTVLVMIKNIKFNKKIKKSGVKQFKGIENVLNNRGIENVLNNRGRN